MPDTGRAAAMFPGYSTLTLRVMMGVHAQYLQRYLDGRSTHVRPSVTFASEPQSMKVDLRRNVSNEIP